VGGHLIRFTKPSLVPAFGFFILAILAILILALEVNSIFIPVLTVNIFLWISVGYEMRQIFASLNIVQLSCDAGSWSEKTGQNKKLTGNKPVW
jgi:hypothetical protein